MNKWASGAMSARLRVTPQRVLEMEFRGIVTREGVMALRRDVLGLLPRDLVALVYRFDRATVALYELGPVDALDPNMRRICIPGAVVCQPEDMPIFRRYAMEALEIGAARVAFTDAEQARAWARRRVTAGRLARLQVQQVQRAAVPVP